MSRFTYKFSVTLVVLAIGAVYPLSQTWAQDSATILAAMSWEPDKATKRSAEITLYKYTSLLQNGDFEQAYEFLIPAWREKETYENWMKAQAPQNSKMRGRARLENIHAIWKKDPPGYSGVYAVYSFQSQYTDVRVQEVVTLQQLKDRSLKVLRHERALMPNEMEGAKTDNTTIQSLPLEGLTSVPFKVKTQEVSKLEAIANEAKEIRKEAKKKEAQRESHISLLALDMDGDGVELLSLWSGDAVYWDIDTDSFAEASGWVHKDDALLAIDKNGDGIINDSNELFGTAEADGFFSLSAYDDNHDMRIDLHDKIWEKLVLWQDRRNDGRSIPNELQLLKNSPIVGIDLNAAQVMELKADNKVTARGRYFMQEPQDITILKPMAIDNVKMSYDNTNSVFQGVYMKDAQAMTLPDMRGYGVMADLRTAMSLDNKGEGNLLDRVKELQGPFESLFDPNRNIEEEVTQALYRWANVQDMVPDSRGPHIDARNLAVLEMYMGEPFIQTGANGIVDPLYFAAISLNEAYLIAYNHIFARFMVQSSGQELFTGRVRYNTYNDRIVGAKGLNLESLNRVKLIADAEPDLEKRHLLWKRVVRTIAFSVGFKELKREDIDILDGLVKQSLNGIGISQLLHEMKNYRHEHSYWRYIIPDRVYKHFGIRYYSNVPYVGIPLLLLVWMFYGAFQRRKVREKAEAGI